IYYSSVIYNLFYKYSFYFFLFDNRRHLHSFPTRRSSDLPRGRSPHVVGVELVPGLGVDDRIPVGVEQRFAFSVLRREVDLPEVLTGFRVDDRVAVLVGEVHRREFPLMKLSGFQLVRRGPPSVDGLTRAVVVDVEVL